jgi:hypothetical protein
VGNTPEGEGLEITSNAPQVFHRDHRRITGGGQRKQRVFPAIGYGDIGLVRPRQVRPGQGAGEGTDRGMTSHMFTCVNLMFLCEPCGVAQRERRTERWIFAPGKGPRKGRGGLWDG